MNDSNNNGKQALSIGEPALLMGESALLIGEPALSIALETLFLKSKEFIDLIVDWKGEISTKILDIIKNSNKSLRILLLENIRNYNYLFKVLSKHTSLNYMACICRSDQAKESWNNTVFQYFRRISLYDMRIPFEYNTVENSGGTISYSYMHGIAFIWELCYWGEELSKPDDIYIKSLNNYSYNKEFDFDIESNFNVRMFSCNIIVFKKKSKNEKINTYVYMFCLSMNDKDKQKIFLDMEEILISRVTRNLGFEYIEKVVLDKENMFDSFLNYGRSHLCHHKAIIDCICDECTKK